MSKLIYKKLTKLVRIDAGLHKMLKILAAREQRSMQSLLEESLSDYLTPNRD